MFEINNHINSKIVFNYINSALQIHDISILIPTYNRVTSFRVALNSAINQSCENYSIIVGIDEDLKQEYYDLFEEVKINSKINLTIYSHEKNLGMFGNWNRLIELTESRYLTFLHDDDYYSENFIEFARSQINKDYNTDAIVIRPHINNYMKSQFLSQVLSIFAFPKKRVVLENFLQHYVTNGLGMVVKKEIFIAIGGYDNIISRHYSGVDFITHALIAAEYKMVYFSKKMNYYNYTNKLDVDEFIDHVNLTVDYKIQLLDYFVSNKFKKRVYFFVFKQQKNYNLYKNFNIRLLKPKSILSYVIMQSVIKSINLMRILNL